MYILKYFSMHRIYMRVKNEDVRKLTENIEILIEDYKKTVPKKERDWRTYEQQLAERVKSAMRGLEPLINEAIASIKIVKAETRGREQELTLKQKVELLLLKHLIGKSNREMSIMLVLFSMLSEIDVSYKSVERLYSDEEVLMVLHNMHILMLKKKGVENPDCAGDGTGYALSVKKHYATEALKRKNKIKSQVKEKMKNKISKLMFIYSFRLIDLDTRMYIAYGTSFKSEKEAFSRAVKMSNETNIDSLRLDKYYSAQKYVRFLEREFGDVKLYLIPKKNATIRGPWKWKRMLADMLNDTNSYLHEYFRRNQSESGFSEDKRRFGWRIAQKREDRVDTANFCTTLWHNMLWLSNK